MFSLISLYFASRRHVVVAERYVAGLTEKPPVAAALSAVAMPAPAAVLVPEELSLAA